MSTNVRAAAIAPHSNFRQARKSTRRLRVMMLGVRGFPDVQGGAENHAQHLSAALVNLGCDVEVIVRRPYCRNSRIFQGIRLVSLWSPRVKGVEAFVHTFIGVLRAAWARPDILHLHAVGPALFTPLARLCGLRVVVTHHVLNYENEKWGPVARSLLRLGEHVGMRFANSRIAVSPGIADRMEQTYRVPVRFIPNGIGLPRKMQSTRVLDAYGLRPQRYVLIVARVDEQKRQLDLIKAFARAAHPDWSLAIVGAADYTSAYGRAVRTAGQEAAGVVLLGHQTGDALAELYTHAGVFVLPSSHEGQPIAVLEAMSYGCCTILSDIAPHREIGSGNAEFVPVGDVDALAARLRTRFSGAARPRLNDSDWERLMKNHDWERIAQDTLAAYMTALRPGLDFDRHDAARS